MVAVRSHAPERDSTMCFYFFFSKADEKKPNLRFVFIVFYVLERENLCRESAAFLEKETERSFFGCANESERLKEEKLKCFNACTTTKTMRLNVKIYSGF